MLSNNISTTPSVRPVLGASGGLFPARQQKPTAVNIPTLLPPGGPQEQSTTPEKKIPLGQAFTKVKNYFRSLGRALIGRSEDTTKNGQVTPGALTENSNAETEGAYNQDDPIVGRWPNGFNNLPQAATKAQTTPPSSNAMPTPTSSTPSSSNDDFANIMSQLNESQYSQEAIKALMEKSVMSGLDGGAL